jgi:hypothetical protein
MLHCPLKLCLNLIMSSEYVFGDWYFYPGKSKDGILLPDLTRNCQSLLDTGQLFHGHAKFRNVYDAPTQLSLCTCVL